MILEKSSKSLCEHLSPVSTCLCSKYVKFCYETLEIDREDEKGHR